MGPLRHSSDHRSVAVVAVTLGWLVGGLWLDGPAWILLVWAWVQFGLSFIGCVINHNHTHCPTFREGWMNRAFNLALTVAKGHTVQTVVVPHQVNHHPRAGGEGDWLAVAHAGSGSGAARVARFVARGVFTMARERRRPGAPQLPVSLARQMRQEQLALGLAVAVAVALAGPGRVLLVAVLPWVASMLALVAVNLPQHDGCDPTDPLRSSRDFTSPLTNWVLFNNGYHTIHHLEPGLHWSQAAQAHATRVRPRWSEADRAAHERVSLIEFMLTELSRP